MKYLKILILAMICISLVLGIVPMSLGAEVPSPKQYATIQEYQKVTGKKIFRFNEAPMLAELVKQGKILPVEKRLPEEPAVIEPLEEIGQYGGKLNTAMVGPGEFEEALIQGLLTTEMYRLGKPIPNIVKDLRVSKDQRIFTFYLRKGLKWSDGTPFTVDDILFWYEDVINNKELTPTFPIRFTFGSERIPAKFERVDDYTFKMTFAGPKPDLIPVLATGWSSDRMIFMPKHYLKQFHPKYQDPKKLETMAKEAKFDFWYQLFWNKNSWTTNPERPVMFPWKVKTPSIGGSPLVLERNPYYWKIDSAGNQLPYIDTIVVNILQNAEIINMKAIAGELDFQARHLYLANYPVFKENEDKGNYRLLEWTVPSNTVSIALNQNTKNPKLRPLFQDRRFRIALSLAINRNEINEIVFLGLGTPRQASLTERDPYYDPEWEKIYLEYNPREANRLLDVLGLTKRDKNGFRLFKDGSPLNLTIEVAPIFADWPKVAEMVGHYWEAVGIKNTVKVEQDSLYYTRAAAGETEVVVYPFNNTAAWGILAYPDHVIGIGGSYSLPWIPEYGRWYLSGGKSGEEPPGDIKRIYQLWDRAISTANEKERSAAIKGIIDIHKRNLFIIGTVSQDFLPVIAKKNLRNVPEGVDQWMALGFPEQFFFK